MKKTTIITAKIRERYAALIDQGVKRYEIRSDSLDGIDAIHLVSTETGKSLGTYVVVNTLCFDRDDDIRVMSLAQTTPEQFYELFPRPEDGGPRKLWAAELGKRTSLDALVARDSELL